MQSYWNGYCCHFIFDSVNMVFRDQKSQNSFNQIHGKEIHSDIVCVAVLFMYTISVSKPFICFIETSSSFIARPPIHYQQPQAHLPNTWTTLETISSSPTELFTQRVGVGSKTRCQFPDLFSSFGYQQAF